MSDAPREKYRDKRLDVGYGRPPSETRFKPGHSGNPSGRPKGSENLSTSVQRVLRSKVKIQEGGLIRKIPAIEAAMKALLVKAMKGDAKACIHVIQLAQEYASPEEEEIEIITMAMPMPFQWEKAKVRIEELEKELEELKKKQKK